MATTSYTEFTAGVRALSDRTDESGAAVDDYSAEEDRFAQAFITQGALTHNAFLVQADTGMNVTVGSGAAKADMYAVEGDVAGQGTYLVRLDQAPVTVAIPAADAAQPRIDEVYLVIADSVYDGGSVTLPRLSVRSGDPGGGAPGPDGGWEASVLLATVAVGASVTQIVAGNITDNRAEAGLSEVLANAAIPAGVILEWPLETAPEGFLLADGSAVSRTTYARLFKRYGTRFGAGDGSTTFNLPNRKGKVAVGLDAAQAEFDTLGATGGEKEHTLTDAEMPSHTHSGPNHTHSGPNHTHTMSHGHSASSGGSSYQHPAFPPLRNVASSGGPLEPVAGVPGRVDHVHGISVGTFFGSTGAAGTGSTGAGGTGATGAAGADDPHNNLQPYVVTNFIVKV